MSNDKKIILLATNCDSTNIIFNSLNNIFGVSQVIIEQRESTKIFLQRRIKRLGIITVFGQILFQLGIAKILAFTSRKRVLDILKENKLHLNEIPNSLIANVNSINDDSVIKLLNTIKPDLIIVNGTRIISKKILQSTTAKFINMHAGITPKYRGVHGAYWALANNDDENCGVTVHFVNEGIDTGNIISQQTIHVTKQDNFYTYPYLQLAIGNKLLIKAVQDFLNNSVFQITTVGESHLWYHPTIWQFVYNYISKKVK
jgi:methionyl-tRNA formyltransferase